MADLVHLNGNKLCVIDTETTGLNPDVHEIIELCILYLDSFFRIDESVPPFHMFITPQKPETMDDDALRVNKVSRVDVMKRGVHPFVVVDAFDNWFTNKLKPVKKIAPLGHNYHFDQCFLKKFFTPDVYDTYFDYHIRDTFVAATFLNDKADFTGRQFPFPKQKLSTLCTRLMVENPAPHTALGDCIATAKCYQKLVQSDILTV